MNSPVKVTRRKSFSSYEDMERKCRKKLTYDSEKREKRTKTLLMAVLTRNYKKRIMEESAKKKAEKTENQSTHRIIFVRRSKSLNYGSTPIKKEKTYGLSEAHEKLKEKIDYVQRLESEFNDAKARREKAEKEEDKLRAALKSNKNYLVGLFQQFKTISTLKTTKIEKCDNDSLV